MQNRILIVAMLAGLPPAALADALDEFVGSWEYEAPGVVERLELTRSFDDLEGIYFGMDFGGERSPYFTATKVSSMTLEEDDLLSFTIPPRKLFVDRQRSLDEAEAIRGPGFTRSEMTMKGHLDGGTLVVACFSKQTVCPALEMIFHKKDSEMRP